MSTRFCAVCRKSYNEDEGFCPRCYGQYMSGKLPFDPIPEELEPFYDTGLEKLSIPFEFWQECEKIRQEALDELKSPRARMGSLKEQEVFRKRVNEEAKGRVSEVIKEYLPMLWKMHDLYESTNDDLENHKIKF